MIFTFQDSRKIFGGVTTSVNNLGKMRRPPQTSLPLLFAEEDQLQPDQVPGEEKLVWHWSGGTWSTTSSSPQPWFLRYGRESGASAPKSTHLQSYRSDNRKAWLLRGELPEAVLRGFAKQLLSRAQSRQNSNTKFFPFLIITSLYGYMQSWAERWAIRSRRWRNSRLAILQFQLVLCLVSTQRTQKWRRWNSWYRLNFCCMVFKSQQYMCCLKAGFDPAKQA